MEPLYRTARVTLYHSDALPVLSSLPGDAIDMVLADPPYNSGGRTATERRAQTAQGKYVSGDAAHGLADFAGDNRDQRSYVTWLSLVLVQCLRLARPGASLLVFSDWRQVPATSDAVQAGGWIWRGIMPWRKPISRPQRNGFRRECEYLLWGSNGEPYRHCPPIYLPGWVSGSQPRGAKRHHITAKPVELLAELLAICPPGGTVLDPFAGSGSAGVAALETGRRYVGMELTHHYAAVAAERLRAAHSTS